VGCVWWLSDGEQGGTGAVKGAEEEKDRSIGGGFIAARGGGWRVAWR
jgi:hypothetical protein